MVSVRFTHGLGDCVHFAHALPLWRRRGHDVAVQCVPFVRPLFEAAGAVIADRARDDHAWSHAIGGPLLPPVWSGNKIAVNLRAWPMPDIGGAEELWEELLGVQIKPWAREAWLAKESSRWFDGRWLIVCHFKGESGCLLKNLNDWAILQFLDAVLGAGDIMVIVVDR